MFARRSESGIHPAPAAVGRSAQLEIYTLRTLKPELGEYFFCLGYLLGLAYHCRTVSVTADDSTASDLVRYAEEINLRISTTLNKALKIKLYRNIRSPCCLTYSATEQLVPLCLRAGICRHIGMCDIREHTGSERLAHLR